MRLASFRLGGAPRGAPPLRRAAILLLVAALHMLLMLMLLRLAPPPAMLPTEPAGPITITLLPDAPASPDAPKARAAALSREPAWQEAAPPPPSKPPPPRPHEPSPSAIWSQVTPITGEAFAAADISRLPAAAASGAGGVEAGSASGQPSGDPGLGQGPNGEPLYNAEWRRRPTRAELAFYLPSGRTPVGWGMIACQTVAGDRVENCLEIASSPAGSGLAGAVRQAAWQFRVLPPRIGGRSLVGAWVRIRIDYTVAGPG